MKILYSVPEAPPDVQQDTFGEMRAIIQRAVAELKARKDTQSLKSCLDVLDYYANNVQEEHYFNLHLWINELNCLDELLVFLIESLNCGKHRTTPSPTEFDDTSLRRGLICVMSFTVKLITNSYHKDMYSSSDRLHQLLDLCYSNSINNENNTKDSWLSLACAAIDTLCALAEPPQNHRQVYAFDARTELHNTPALTLPLFDILLASHNTGLSATRPPQHSFSSSIRSADNSNKNSADSSNSSVNSGDSSSGGDTSGSNTNINSNSNSNSNSISNSGTPPVPTSSQRVQWWSRAFGNCQASLTSRDDESNQQQQKRWRMCCRVQWKVFSIIVLCHKVQIYAP
jgi:hypothetical protein